MKIETGNDMIGYVVYFFYLYFEEFNCIIILYNTSRSSRRHKRRLCAACAPGYGFTKNRFPRVSNLGLQTKSLES